MKKTIIILTYIICSIILYPLKGVAMAINPKNVEKIKEAYKKIDISDGVSKDEAIVIAKYFVITNNGKLVSNLKMNTAEVGNSGFNENWWAVGFDATFSVKMKSGLKWFSVHVDKSTGEIKSQGWGPS